MVDLKNNKLTQDKRIDHELKEIKIAEITGILGKTTNLVDQKVMNEVMRMIEGGLVGAKVDSGLS